MRWVRVLAPEEKTLIVIREPDTIEFFFSKDNRRWRVYPHPEKARWFIVEEYEKGKRAEIKINKKIEDNLKRLNISKVFDLYEALFKDPEIMIEWLIGEK